MAEINKENYEQMDMVLVNERWRNSITNIEAKHDSGINSDHVPVKITARIRLAANGPSTTPI